MRVAGIERTGAAVEIFDVADPGPAGEGQVLVEVRAAGVGNCDEVVRTGGWDVGRSAPMALGVEAAGVVIATGPEVRGWSVGDEVGAGMTPVGYPSGDEVARITDRPGERERR